MTVYQNWVIIESSYKVLSGSAKEGDEPATAWDLEIWLQLFLTLAPQTEMNKLNTEKKVKELPYLFHYSMHLKRQNSLPVKFMIPMNYFAKKNLKDTIFLCDICITLIIMEVTQLTWGGKYNIK